MNRLLMIVDPQIDFICGSLPVEGATLAMDTLADFIRKHDGDYIYKVVTSDWHPYRHCSFKEQGGQWPLHCVHHTIGAAVYPALIEPLNTTRGTLKILHKGIYEDREEYSIFKNLASAQHLKTVITTLGIGQIDLCGIAGDVCVLDTLKDGIELYGKEMFNVLTPFCPSLDGGKALSDFLKKNNL